MKQKNLKNEGMSWVYKWLSIEVGFKLSGHYTMIYSAVDQIRYT